jgi:hypothetical protein
MYHGASEDEKRHDRQPDTVRPARDDHDDGHRTSATIV